MSAAMERPPGRPAEPDEEVLEEALLASGHREGRWSVGARMDRPQSTVFPLRLVADGRTVLNAYYKEHTILSTQPDVRARKLASFRRLLSNGPDLTRQYHARGGSDLAAMPAILVSDPDRLVEVQVAVPGAPFDRLFLHALPGRRSNALRVYEAVGGAIRIIEQCSDAHLEATTSFSFDFDRAVAGLEDVLDPGDRRRLSQLFHCLGEQVRQRAPTYAHGDLGGGNILAEGGKAALIDSLWAIRWPGYDIAHHATRIEYDVPRLGSWNRRLIDKLIEGYGEPDLRAAPGWRLARIWNDVHLAMPTTSGRLRGHRSRKAVARLREELSRTVR